MTSKTERKICGTCNYWIGNREPIFDKNSRPKISINDKIGICQKPDSRFCDKKRKNDSNCSKYSKWTEIL